MQKKSYHLYKLIKFSSAYVAVAQFTAYSTLNSFNKLKNWKFK